MMPMMDQRFLEQLLSQFQNASAAQIEQMKNFKAPQCFQFTTGDKPLIIFDEPKAVYTPNDCENPDMNLITNSSYFHQILVHHDGQFNQQQILNGFFEVVDGELFIPIGYRSCKTIDYFFIAKEHEAMKKLFEKKLLIPMKDRSLRVVIKAGAAECHSNHRFYPKINEVIAKCVKQSTSLGGYQTLNLDQFAQHPELREMSINLGNTGTLDLLLNSLNGHPKLKQSSQFRIFKFARNHIKSLSPFLCLYNFKMETLDLSYNDIIDIQEIKNLKFLNVQELYLKGNECCENPDNLEKIREILPGLRKLDNIAISTTPTIYKTNIRGQATKIGNKPIPASTVKTEISIAQKNRIVMLKTVGKIYDANCWTKVLIHHDDKFKQEQILKVLVKDVCYNAQIFPCYPKRFKGRDEFFLYKSFDAIKIMMQKELKVVMSPMDAYNIHINLNATEFVEEQVEWSENLKYVISKRIEMGRNGSKMNLNDFAKEELLSNIYICLDNFNNLNFILDQARQVTNQLTEIHMENCGISQCEGFFILSAFEKLKLLNLRNNNIEKLEGIRRANTIVEVFLDGNPICNQDPVSYITNVCNYFPSLEWLDGCRVEKGASIITFQNYLVTIDVYTVVDEFLKHFFTLWDSFERSQLKAMYKPNSILTLCMNYEYNKEKDLAFNEIYPRVQKFVNFDRNLKKISARGGLLAIYIIVYCNVYCGILQIKKLKLNFFE